MSTFGEFPSGARGVVRVSLTRFRGVARADVREFFTPIDGQDLQPTRRGTSVPVKNLPQLRAAIAAAEFDALTSGLIGPEDYEAAGLQIPTEVRIPGL